MEEREPYALGGSRDPRVRAIRGAAMIEETVETVESLILPLRQGGRLKRIGRLALRYERGQQHFRWRWKVGPRNWEDVGRRVPFHVRRRLRAGTRAKVDGVERWLDIREIGVKALRLIVWCTEQGGTWTENVVTLRWRSDLPRGVCWSFMLSGGRLQRGGVLTEQGPSGQFQYDIETLMRGRPRHDEGEVTGLAKELVRKLHAVDARLHQLRKDLRGVIRIYYGDERDTFQMRQVTGKGWSIYHGQQVGKEVMGWLTLAERPRVQEAVSILAERTQLKRALQVIATIGEAMRKWPGGVWQMRGERGKGEPAKWVAQITKRGVLVRRYTAEQTGMTEVDEEDHEEW